MTGERRGWRNLAVAVLCALFLFPLVFMVLGSLRTPLQAPPDGFEFLPEPMRWANYQSVFGFLPLWSYMKNSAVVVAVAVPVTVLIASWAGFAIATGTPKVRRILIGLSVVALMVPASALWIPRFVLFKWTGINDTLLPLMSPALMATTPFYVLLFAVAYWRIPRPLYEAAALEGLSPMKTWWRVAWPLGRPAAFAVAVLAFAFHWSNFIDALLYLPDVDLYTMPLGLRALQSLEPTNHSILLAGAVMATLPAVLAFVLVQRALFARTLEVR